MRTRSIAPLVAAIACAFVLPVSLADAAQYGEADAAHYSEKVLHSFGSGSDGADPFANVIDVRGKLYGTTFGGGDFGYGTVFTLDLNTGAEKVLYAFGCSPDGNNPEAGVIDVNGTLYGATAGGDCGEGSVFALDLKTDAEKSIYNFCNQTNCVDGDHANGGVIDVNGTLYGTTFAGGAYGMGTVFSLDSITGAEKVLYSFCGRQNCADGELPTASLIEVNGVLYGTADSGGVPGCHQNFGCGVAFSINLNTGAEKTLYTFCSRRKCADGANPFAGLIAVNGMLYGTAVEGGRVGCGNAGCGTVFSIDPNTGVEKVLHSFCRLQNCADGVAPQTNLIDASGTLYGTTSAGGGTGCGGTGCGTVFSISPDTGIEKVLYSFAGGTDGEAPRGSVIDVKGTLYGTTVFGGTNNFGTIFALRKR